MSLKISRFASFSDCAPRLNGFDLKFLSCLQVQTVNDCAFVCQGLQEERFRSERLEEQINDLTELHQAETGNLKQALADTEEKLSYQSEERLRDLAELLDACQVKVTELEITRAC